MREKKVQTIFIIVLIFLPLQYAVVGIVGSYAGEPWPAFVFPGFKNVYVYNGLYELPQSSFDLFDSDGEKIASLQPYQLFRDLPRSQINGFMRLHFQDEEAVNNLSQEVKYWLKQKSEEATGQNTDHIEVFYYINYYKPNGEALRLDSQKLQFKTIVHLGDP